NHIGTRERLYRWKIKDITSAECKICHTATEDIYHMIVDCPWKRPFWIDALNYFQLSNLLPSQRFIWQAIISFRSPNNRILEDATISKLGATIAVLWRCHWRCIIDNDDWSTTTAMNFLMSDT
ncbi:hypothetical protein K492DRAFT_116030, partial [Lichtheimia hyalospora FSU 10163]